MLLLSVMTKKVAIIAFVVSLGVLLGALANYVVTIESSSDQKYIRLSEGEHSLPCLAAGLPSCGPCPGEVIDGDCYIKVEVMGEMYPSYSPRRGPVRLPE